MPRMGKETTPSCEHPQPRVRYHVADDIKPDSRGDGFTLVPTLYGMCCDCGEVVAENALSSKRLTNGSTAKTA